MNIEWASIDACCGNFTSTELAAYRPCPVCGSINSRIVTEFSDFQFFSDSNQQPKRLDVKENQCLDCFALYLNPCYTQFGFKVLFAEAGRSYGSTDGRQQEQIKWLDDHGLLKANTLILDAGCYDGQFLASLPDNVQKVGVDIDLPAIELGRKRYHDKGIEFIYADFERFNSDRAPDVITMFHVLEHLADPLHVLRNLRTNAHSNTNLVIEVPIVENGTTNDINGFFSVQHMTHFSKKSLSNCLNRAGWKIKQGHEKPGYNGYRVLAIPSVPDDNIVGDPEDTQYLYEYLSAWYQALENANRRTGNVQGFEKAVIWGGGMHTEFVYQTTNLFSVDKNFRFIIVDSDPLKHGKTWRGITIYHPSVLRKIDWMKTCLVVSSYGSQEAIVCAARDLAVPPGRIVRLYDELRVY